LGDGGDANRALLELHSAHSKSMLHRSLRTWTKAGQACSHIADHARLC
jgi:hypothetical protein